MDGLSMGDQGTRELELLFFFIDTCIIHLSFFFFLFHFLVFFSFFPHTSLVVWGLIFIASNIRGWSR